MLFDESERHIGTDCLPVMQYALMVAHWAACIFYFIARQNNFTNTTWVGHEDNKALFEGKPNIIRQVLPIRYTTHVCIVSC